MNNPGKERRPLEPYMRDEGSATSPSLRLPFHLRHACLEEFPN
jgi:hypothetical protein